MECLVGASDDSDRFRSLPQAAALPPGRVSAFTWSALALFVGAGLSLWLAGLQKRALHAPLLDWTQSVLVPGLVASVLLAQGFGLHRPQTVAFQRAA